MNSEFAAAKNVDGPQPPIHLAPSQILGFEFIERQRTEDYAFNADGQQEPRLAAVEVGGRWFALDGSRLEYYQRLERDGNCRRVTVEPVPATQLSDETRSKIAETLASDRNNALSLNDPLIRGYESLDEDRNGSSNATLDSTTRAVDDDDDDDDQEEKSSSNGSSSSSSGDEDGDDSSSECGSHYLDWSEDEGDSSEDESEGDDDDDDDDDESYGPKIKRPSATDAGTSDASAEDNEKLLCAAAEEEEEA